LVKKDYMFRPVVYNVCIQLCGGAATQLYA